MFDPRSALGTTVGGKYVLAEHLGSGSFGWVYSADRMVLGEAMGGCAIKLVRPKDEAEREEVMAEIRAMARLQHPRLLGFFDAGAVAEGLLGGAIYIAMELAEGTLADRLKRPDALAEDEVLAVAREVAEALVYIHSQGAVHRDVKPENVFRTASGWKLGDLGLARAVQGSAVVASGRKGTPLYMAPEVCLSQTGAAVDVWSLGVLVQQCAARVLPYVAASDVELIAKLLTEEPVIAPALPPRFAGLVRGCLVKERAGRWTAARALEALASPVGAGSNARSPSLSRDAQGSSAPAAAGVASGWSVPASRPASASPAPVSAPAASPPARAPAPQPRTGPPEATPGVLDAERWVLVPAGRFRMGSPADDREAYEDERPQHDVTITRPYSLKVTPVTQAEWREVMGSSPSRFKGDALPVEQVSWLDAVAFCNELSDRAGIEPAYIVRGKEVTWHGLAHPGFRLPTEAEWEHACRAGTTAPRYGALDDVAWHSGNSKGQTRPVGGRRPNPWGFHDMLGNVWEWCWDRWSDNHQGAGAVDPTGPSSGASGRVDRGGSWRNGPRYVRAAYRNWSAPGGRIGNLGFRPARSGP